MELVRKDVSEICKKGSKVGPHTRKVLTRLKQSGPN